MYRATSVWMIVSMLALVGCAAERENDAGATGALAAESVSLEELERLWGARSSIVVGTNGLRTSALDVRHPVQVLKTETKRITKAEFGPAVVEGTQTTSYLRGANGLSYVAWGKAPEERRFLLLTDAGQAALLRNTDFSGECSQRDIETDVYCQAASRLAKDLAETSSLEQSHSRLGDVARGTLFANGDLFIDVFETPLFHTAADGKIRFVDVNFVNGRPH
jgi:hypothetical protein